MRMRARKALKREFDLQDGRAGDLRGSAAGELELVLDRLRPRLRIAVVFAGDSTSADAVINRTFNTRPWKSYEAVANDIAQALRGLGFLHVELVAEDMRLGETLRRSGAHLAWLNTAGVQGINPSCHAPAVLEMLGIPYVGHNPLAVTMLDNKHWFKRELAAVGFATPAFTVWSPMLGPFTPEADARFRATFDSDPGPFVVKPAVGRASLHVHLVPDRRGLPASVAEVGMLTNGEVLIEAYMPGREFVVAAAGPTIARDGRIFRLDEPFVFGAQERVLQPGECIFTSMDQRPITRERVHALDDAEDAAIKAELCALARAVHKGFHLSSLIRLDIRADAQGRLQILEANPKPDLKRPSAAMTSLVGEGLSEFAMSYDDLILALLADRIDQMIRRQAGVYRGVEALL